jgi:hypothetical protein
MSAVCVDCLLVQEETVDTVYILKDKRATKGSVKDNGVEWKMQLHGFVDIKSGDGKEKLEMQWNAKGDTTKMVGG